MPCPLPRTLVVLAALLALLPAPLSAQPAASEDGGGDEPLAEIRAWGFTSSTTRYVAFALPDDDGRS